MNVDKFGFRLKNITYKECEFVHHTWVEWLKTFFTQTLPSFFKIGFLSNPSDNSIKPKPFATHGFRKSCVLSPRFFIFCWK